jgi:hypothetical protein
MHTVLLLAGGLAALLLVLRVVGGLLVQRHAETLDFRGPVRRVEVAVAAGEVTVRGSARRDARVRRTTRHTFRRPRFSEAVDDGILRLEAPTGVVQYEVDVPEGATVTVRGDAASATVINVTGAVELRATAGTLEGRGLSGSAVHAVTGEGSIRLAFDRAPELVEAATRTGSVELVLPAGDTDIRARCPEPVRILRR